MSTCDGVWASRGPASRKEQVAAISAAQQVAPAATGLQVVAAQRGQLWPQGPRWHFLRKGRH